MDLSEGLLLLTDCSNRTPLILKLGISLWVQKGFCGLIWLSFKEDYTRLHCEGDEPCCALVLLPLILGSVGLRCWSSCLLVTQSVGNGRAQFDNMN